MRLLAQSTHPDLPFETLLVRLRARRRELGGIPTGDSGRALDWLHARLDPGTRRRLEPYLELLASRWLCQMLRHRLAGESLPPSLQLPPLLDPELCRLVASRLAGIDLLDALERRLAGETPWITGLAGSFLRQGPGGVEQQLELGPLCHGLRRARHRLVRRLLRQLLDIRNLLAVLRYWRWQVKLPPDLAPGGEIPVKRLLRIWGDGDRSALARAAGKLAGEPVGSDDPRQVERALLQGITVWLRRTGRDPLGLGVVLDYLWQLQLAAVRQRLEELPGTEPERLWQEGVLA